LEKEIWSLLGVDPTHIEKREEKLKIQEEELEFKFNNARNSVYNFLSLASQCISNLTCTDCKGTLKVEKDKTRTCTNLKCGKSFFFDGYSLSFIPNENPDFLNMSGTLKKTNRKFPSIPENLSSNKDNDNNIINPPVGLVNRKYLCWLNSFIQILFHIPIFRTVSYFIY
jgi:hypothetical protein